MSRRIEGYFGVKTPITSGAPIYEMWTALLDDCGLLWVAGGRTQSVSVLEEMCALGPKGQPMTPTELGGAVDESGNLEVFTHSEANAHLVGLIDGHSVLAVIRDQDKSREDFR